MTENSYIKGTRYYVLPDDGGLFTCVDCKEQSLGTKNHATCKITPRTMLFVITPSGNTSVLHQECVEPHWFAAAKRIVYSDSLTI